MKRRARDCVCLDPWSSLWCSSIAYVSFFVYVTEAEQGGKRCLFFVGMMEEGRYEGVMIGEEAGIYFYRHVKSERQVTDMATMNRDIKD